MRDRPRAQIVSFCFLLLLSSLAFAQEKDWGRMTLEEALLTTDTRQMPHSIHHKYIERTPQEISQVIRDTMSETKSGMVLRNCLIAAVRANIKADELPAPTRTAFSEYVAERFYYKFQPRLFWPHYPQQWQRGMRNVLIHALEVRYPYANLNEAVPLLPLFFPDGHELEKLYLPQSMTEAAIYNAPPQLYYVNYELHRLGLKHWISAVWRNSTPKRREEIIKLFYIEPGPQTKDTAIPQPHDPNRHKVFRPELLPLHQWLRDNPQRLDEWLFKSNKDTRQEVLGQVLASEEPLVDERDPRIISLMIEGLPRGYYKGQIHSRRFVQNSDKALPLMRSAFLESQDLRQKSILCHLLIWLDDKPSEKDRLEFLYSGLPARETGRLPRIWLNDFYWYYTSQRHRNIPRDLCWMGDAAREFLLEKIRTCEDPQQLAISIAVIVHLDGGNRIAWDERQTEVLARGLRTNSISRDFGFCALALRLGGSKVLPVLLMLALTDPDPQLWVAYNALGAFNRGDLKTYKSYWVYRKPGNVYYEYGPLDPAKLLPVDKYKHAYEQIYNSALSRRGDETWKNQFSARYGLRED